MKTTLKALALATVALAYSCGQSHDAAQNQTSDQVAPNAKDTVHAYVCPMRCEGSGSMKEGLCSVCSMDLSTNPDFPGHESMAIGEEPVGGAPIVDSTMIAEEEQHQHEGHEGHDSHEGHNH
ncbi:MAG: hypothetical protein ACKOYC_06850 [Bacteroidota bacterium]